MKHMKVMIMSDHSILSIENIFTKNHFYVYYYYYLQLEKPLPTLHKWFYDARYHIEAVPSYHNNDWSLWDQ